MLLLLLAGAQLLHAFFEVFRHGVDRLRHVADFVLVAVSDPRVEFSCRQLFARRDQARQPSRHAESEKDGKEDGQRHAGDAGNDDFADEFLAPLAGIRQGDGEVQAAQLPRAEHDRRDDIVACIPGQIESCPGFRQGLHGIPVRGSDGLALQVAQHDVVDVAVGDHVAQQLVEGGVVALGQRDGNRGAEQRRELAHLVPDAVFRAAVDDV
ncbi:MAG: hypothetical protein MOGDAGHF_01609 [Rhodocyclaceae bacterium]|nr:hypothetical protein [Rhodocyclaceae bacterium]